MDAKQKLAIASESSQAVFKFVSQFAVSVFDTHDRDDDPSSWEVFSGTLVEIGDHFFVATASHCVHTPLSPSRYWILGDRPHYKSDGIPVIIAGYGMPGDRPDVGILEVDWDSLARHSTKTPCPIERIQIAGIGRPNRIVSLVGSPGQYVEPESRGEARGFKSVVISYSTVPIGASEWPTFGANPPLDQNIDILLEYPGGVDHTTRLDTGAALELPHPGGMSGGGLWDQGFDTGTMWSTDNAFLFGIQSAWFPNRRYVRAVQIKHWLRLVHQHYPDLRAELDQRFPDLHTNP